MCWEFPDGHALANMCSGRASRKLVQNQPCPSANLIATCTGTSMTTKFYSGPQTTEWTPERAAEECKELHGTLQ